MQIVNTRPRIFITPSILATLKARAAKPTSRWSTLLQRVERPADWNVGIPNYALAYAVTGSPYYAAQAWSLMAQSMQVGLGQITGDQGYQARIYFLGASLILDWCNAALTTDQRIQLVNDMIACCDWVWPETNPARSTVGMTKDPLSNYFHGYMLTWIAGLALSGETPKAQGYVDNALNRWNTLAQPTLATLARGGVAFEGSNYDAGSLRSIVLYLLAHSTATNEDLLKSQLAIGWVGDAMNAMMCLTTPSRDRIVPYGDQAGATSGGEITDTHRIAALVGAAYGDANAKEWLDTTIPNLCTQVVNAWSEALFYPENP